MKYVVHVVALLVGAVLTTLASASEARPDKRLVIAKTAEAFFDAYKSKYSKRPVKPRLFIAEVSNGTKSLSDEEVTMVADKLEELLVGFAEILDRDKTVHVSKEETYQNSGAVDDAQVQALGQKHGATQLVFLAFQDSIAPVKKNEEAITVTGKISAIDVKTSRKDLVKTVSVEYEHTTFTESYYVRDTLSIVAATTGTVSAIGAVILNNKAEESHKKYDDADNPDDATKYRKESKQTEHLTWGAAGISAASWLLWYWAAYGERNQDVYHEYECRPPFKIGPIGRFTANEIWTR